MFDIPPDLPQDYTEYTCMAIAARKQQLPEEILWAIRLQEQGSRGTVSQNTDGSYDVGVMQINSIHFKEFQQKWGIKPSWLVHSNCISILAAAFILRREIDRAGSFWAGVGAYNSRTPSLNYKYREKIMAIIRSTRGSLRLMELEAQPFMFPSNSYEKFINSGAAYGSR